MSEEQIQRLVAEVISRLATRLGADGSRGLLMVVFTGATAGFREALQQVRRLVLSGYRIQTAFSKGASELYARVVRNQLSGFPHIETVDPGKWLSALQSAHAVVVPLLSVNTLSKLALLIADDLSTNLILHGLFMGKPIIVARNGADPEKPGRRELGFHLGSPALNRALMDRLRILGEFGCILVDVDQLGETVQLTLPRTAASPEAGGHPALQTSGRTLSVSEAVITSLHVTHAHRAGANLVVTKSTLITPLARELAARCGVDFLES